jgi:hypothetical protein
MLSFRTDDAEAAAAQEWAARLGIDRSELLREALHAHLARLATEDEATRWAEAGIAAESDFDEIADWGPAEDWSDWSDAAR